MKYFRVKTGYGAEDFISIDETEVERAIIAQGTGKVAVFKHGTATGNHIITVKPDLQKILGYNALYQLKPEDYHEIPKQVLIEHEDYLAQIGSKVTGQPLPEPRNPLKIHTQGLKGLGELINKK